MTKSLDNRILDAFYKGYTYKEIQKECGGISKGVIKETIKNKNPELYAIIGNAKKLKEYRDNIN